MDKTILMMKNVGDLNERERFDLIHSVKSPKEALDYLKFKLQNLSIEILGDYKGTIIELMSKGLLEGWCWQTTESAIVFLEDDDYIERGNLKLRPDKEYWHSWICFNFENQKLAFDPCLQILIESSIYHHIFEISVKGIVTAKQVREDLIYRINNHKKEAYDKKNEDSFEKFFAPYRSERQKTETHISGNNDVNSPMYRNNTGYNAIIENRKIKNLTAHYYLCGY